MAGEAARIMTTTTVGDQTDRLKTLPDGSFVRQVTPWAVIGMSRASWYRHGKPEIKPKRRTRAALARSVGVSVRTVYRVVRKFDNERIARLRQYQEEVMHKLLKKDPRKSDQQIADMVNAHVAALSDEELARS